MMAARTIRAIPTDAYDEHFRSRTEARFATFLEEAGIEWRYEPKVYRLPSGGYLPDFRLRLDWAPDQVWVEIKPASDTFDDPRWGELTRNSGLMILTVRGLHRRGDTCGRDHTVRVWHPSSPGYVYDVPKLWTGTQFASAWDAAWDIKFDGQRPAARRRKGRRR